jgi:REP element-mobilizing transposase RayT
MPREKRLVVVGTPHHITQRGNNRQAVFRSGTDRHFYLKTLKAKCEQHNLRILGYCLMTNHVHLVATPEYQSSMARALGQTHMIYAQRFNLAPGGDGALQISGCNARTARRRGSGGSRSHLWNRKSCFGRPKTPSHEACSENAKTADWKKEEVAETIYWNGRWRVRGISSRLSWLRVGQSARGLVFAIQISKSHVTVPARRSTILVTDGHLP